MRIAVNTRLLLQGRLEGLGRFSAETLKILTSQHSEHEFFFLFDRPYSEEFIFSSNVTPLVLPPPARHPLLWYLWFELSVPRVLDRLQPDLFLSPDGFLSLRTETKSLPVIHDVNFVNNPQDLARAHAWFYNRYFPLYAKKAERIATVSEFSKHDISERYGVALNRIDVVYNGVSERFHPIAENEKRSTRLKWTGGAPFFIFVGSIHQRKNIERMLEAFDAFRDAQQQPFRFVFAGNRKWWTASMQQTLDGMKYKDDVIFAGRVEDAELNRLLGAATANVYVSTFEGFGIPIVEAFQAEVPVITSTTTSMPEVAGDAAIKVDPFDVGQITQAMIEVVESEALRSKLISLGTQRAAEFTWQRTADLLWESIEKVLDS